MPAEVEFFEGETENDDVEKKWYWHVQDGNNRVVADGSESYTRRFDAVRGFKNATAACVEALAGLHYDEDVSSGDQA